MVQFFVIILQKSSKLLYKTIVQSIRQLKSRFQRRIKMCAKIIIKSGFILIETIKIFNEFICLQTKLFVENKI